MKSPIRESIESHSSYLSNKRLNILFFEIDRLGLISSGSPHYDNITHYFNAIEQLYINVSAVLLNRNDIETEREKFYKLNDLVQNNKKFRNKKALLVLLQLARKYNYLIIEGLQKMSYFFRTKQVEKKGLKNIKFFEETIFGVGGNNEDEGEDEGEV